jgi:hypothetical protein
MPAGISGEVVRTLPWDSKGIMLSENTTMLGSSLWVEVILEDGTMGWVNAWNLTEYHPQLEFCNDLRPKEVLEEVTPLLASGALAELTPYVHENRGLTIRLSWSNPDVYFTKSDLATLITDEEEQDWGVYIGSDIPARGTFQEVIYPKLESVFSTSHQISCNTLQFGVTSGDVVWPSEFINLNFYSFYRSASPGGNVYDWRTWAIGIEYIDGEPFIAVLIHYTSEL